MEEVIMNMDCSVAYLSFFWICILQEITCTQGGSFSLGNAEANHKPCDGIPGTNLKTHILKNTSKNTLVFSLYFG